MDAQTRSTRRAVRPHITLAACVVLAAVAVAWLYPLSAAAQSQEHVVWQAATGKSTWAPGLRLGDRYAARFPLYDATQTAVVGKGYQDCVIVRRISDEPAGLYWCSYALELADGTLLLEGLDPAGVGQHQMAVVGGTVTYVGATGSATLTDTFTETDFVIDLL